MKIQETYRNNGKGYKSEVTFEVDSKKLEKAVVDKARKPLGAINLEDVARIAFELGAKYTANAIRSCLEAEEETELSTYSQKDKDIKKEIEQWLENEKFRVSSLGCYVAKEAIKLNKSTLMIAKEIEKEINDGESFQEIVAQLILTGDDNKTRENIEKLERLLKKYDEE